MTLTTLLLWITVVALGLTGLTYFVFKKKDSLLLSLLQNFCGALFLFSGYVKAVDPLGTAYKMEQYFAEFESTFADTALSFIAPLFPMMSELSVGFSVFMIVLEIVLGLALILGAWPKLTSWLFFLIVVFFTVLTGFTYTTGYVPSGVNYFAFAEWGDYMDSNMKVTDCGCFGVHNLFTEGTRNIALGVLTVVTLLYSFSNYAWDIPGQDFRPFKVGTDVATVKQAEADAAANVTTLAYVLTNKASGEVQEIETNAFLKVMGDYHRADKDQ